MALAQALSKIIVSCSVAISGCAGSESFTVWPGFKQYFEQYPPSAELPDARQTALLEKYKPRVFLESDQQGPVDFYQQYIADGKLKINGKKIAGPITQQILNRYVDHPDALFIYHGNATPGGPAVVYARYDEDTLNYQGTDYPLQFLTYNLTFPTSGMLKGLGAINSAALAIAGNLTDWHQLDHYVGLSVALYREQPIAVMLQQHNYQTTYIFNNNIDLPEDNRVAVDIAMRSNELYLHSDNEVEHPALSFITGENIGFLMTGKNKPFMAGYDVTHGEQEIDYQLVALPQTDAFYQFKGHLGKSRLLPGRDGPPGADYVTLPGLMPRAARLVAGYRTSNQQKETDKINALFDMESFSVNTGALNAYSEDFLKAASMLPN